MEIDAVSAPVHIQEAIGEEEERRALIDAEPGVEQYGTMGSSNGESILQTHPHTNRCLEVLSLLFRS